MEEFKGDVQVIVKNGEEYNFSGCLKMPSWDCPLCTKPMTDIIIKCENGHWMCGGCIARVNGKCHMCRTEIDETDMWGIAMVVRDTLIAECDNDECDHRSFLGDGEARHKETCVHQMMACPRCTMETTYSQYRNHFFSMCGAGARRYIHTAHAVTEIVDFVKSSSKCAQLVSTRHTWMSVYISKTAEGVEFMAVASQNFDGPIVRWYYDNEDGSIGSKKLRPYCPGNAPSAPNKVVIPNSDLGSIQQVMIMGTIPKFAVGNKVIARLGNKNVAGIIRKNIADSESGLIGDLVEVQYVDDDGKGEQTITLNANDVKHASGSGPRMARRAGDDLLGMMLASMIGGIGISVMPEGDT